MNGRTATTDIPTYDDLTIEKAVVSSGKAFLFSFCINIFHCIPVLHFHMMQRVWV